MIRSALICAMAVFVFSPPVNAQPEEAEHDTPDENRVDCGRSRWIAGAVLLSSGAVLDAMTIVGALTAENRGGRIAAEVGFMVGISAIIVGTVSLAIGLIRRARCLSFAPPSWSLGRSISERSSGDRERD